MALSQQNLGNCVYMMDTNRYLGSNGAGGSELQTVCVNGQRVVWTVVSIDPNLPVAIGGFSSNGSYPAAYPNMINPTAVPDTGGMVWGGNVNQANTQAQYSVNLLVGDDNTPMSFDPFITATNQ
ncbi:hypothetical protein D0T25_12280 [Duganella sp. BJB488]|nr:hypothetical protein D0T26_15020 [Duganella sp. BJB489]RFP22375.1 hypothetical protein D0T25_12280 [Duganella sp. BJB488]RFP37973.1 hypothetical protein D0T24_05120 [Duganella sp. BJB480]